MQALTPTGDFYFLAFTRCKYSVYIANCAAFINPHFTLVLVEFIDDPSLVTRLFTKQILVYVALFRLYDGQIAKYILAQCQAHVNKPWA